MVSMLTTIHAAASLFKEKKDTPAYGYTEVLSGNDVCQVRAACVLS